MIIEVEIEGIFFGLEGLKNITSFKGFKKSSEPLKLKDTEKGWTLVLEARKKNKESKKD